MIDLAALEALKKEWESIRHGPCFPLKLTERFGSHRFEDAQGNVVIEQPYTRKNPECVWLPEAAEFFVLMANAAPELIALAEEALAARKWLQHREAWYNAAPTSEAHVNLHYDALHAYCALVAAHDGGKDG